MSWRMGEMKLSLTCQFVHLLQGADELILVFTLFCMNETFKATTPFQMLLIFQLILWPGHVLRDSVPLVLCTSSFAIMPVYCVMVSQLWEPEPEVKDLMALFRQLLQLSHFADLPCKAGQVDFNRLIRRFYSGGWRGCGGWIKLIIIGFASFHFQNMRKTFEHVRRWPSVPVSNHWQTDTDFAQ